MDVLYDARLLHRPLSGLERVQRNMLRALAVDSRVRRLRAFVLHGTKAPAGLPARVELVPVHSTESMLAVLLGDDPPDVYHLTYFPDRNPRDLLLPIVAAASVVEVHDAILNRHPEYYPDRRAWGWYHDFVRRLIRSCDRLLIHSESARGEVERDLDGDASIADLAPLAVDPALLQALPLEEVQERLRRLEVRGDYVLALGKDYPHKDHATLFRAVATLPELHVVCAGSRVWHRPGESSDELCKSLGIGDRVRWIEGLDDHDVKALMQGARCLAYPSREEGFGLPPVEAMALGTPVVACASMSIPEVCGDGAWFFAPGDHGEMAARLRAVLAGGARVRELVERGRQRAASLSWERSADATVRCYERALAAARAGNPSRPRLPANVRDVLACVAASPHDDGRDLLAWTERCLQSERHLNAVEADRQDILRRLNELERGLGQTLTEAHPPPASPPARWSIRRRLRKIRAGIKRRLGE
ncbi:MAG: glycosyltransferase family 1 protein [Planctomycetota bacterium]